MINKKHKSILYLILPCRNEQEILPQTASVLLPVLENLIITKNLSHKSRILFIDDGSTDLTWDIICHMGQQFPSVAGISLRQRLGQQKALFTGLMAVRRLCGAAVTMDADLQDDPSALPAILDAWKQGSQIVDTIRTDRSCDSFSKQAGAWFFYRMMNLLCGKGCMEGDYRLLGSLALKKLSSYYGGPCVLRVLIPQLRLPAAAIPFVRQKRPAGQSKYSFKNMVSLAFSAILSAPFFSRLYLRRRRRISPWSQIGKTINLPVKPPRLPSCLPESY